MEGVELLYALCSLSSCCVDCSTNIEEKTPIKKYNQLNEIKEDKTLDELKKLNVVFFYDNSDERIDKNIHRIIFYEEYIRGYYNEYSIDKTTKNILLVYNRDSSNISNIITIVNNIHRDKGLTINNNKWIPNEVWIYN